MKLILIFIIYKGDKVDLFKNPGFTINGLMKDMRYRLSTVLYVNDLI